MAPRIVPRKIDVAGVRRALDVRQTLHERLAASTPRLHAPAGAETGVARPTTGTVDATRPLTLVVLGESTALGIGCDRPEEILAARLAQRLADREGRPVSWRTAAADGATADHCTTHLVDRLAGDPVDVVAVALGVNDLIRGRRPAVFARDVEALVTRVRGLQPGAVVVLSGLPDPTTMPLLPAPVAALLARRAATLDERVAATAERHRMAYVPVRDVPLKAEHLAADGFHPGPAGCVLWAEQLAAAIPPLDQRRPARWTGAWPVD